MKHDNEFNGKYLTSDTIMEIKYKNSTLSQQNKLNSSFNACNYL